MNTSDINSIIQNIDISTINILIKICITYFLVITLKSIIAKSDLVIGNDTGPTHMAWGLNIPSITIFGPTPINRVYQTPINRVIKSDSEVDHYNLDKNDFSIGDIKSDDIIKMARELLDD